MHTDQLGLITTYEYDVLNRVIEIKVPTGGTKQYAYDEVDNVTSMTDELNHKTTYDYTLTKKCSKQSNGM